MPVKTKLYVDGSVVPYFEASYKQTFEYTDVLSFQSPLLLEEGLRVKLVGPHESFGGTIVTSEDVPDGYSYECQNWQRSLNGKIRKAFYNKTPATMIKEICKSGAVGIGGIDNGPNTKFPKMIFKDLSRWNICQQIANEIAYDFFVNPDNVAIFKEQIPPVYNNYTFHRGQSILNHDLKNDVSDILTSIVVYGKDSKRVGFAQDKNLIKKYGRLEDSITDEKVTSATGDLRAKVELSKKGKAAFTGSITIPPMERMKPRIWVNVPVLRTDGSEGYNSYYVNEVELTISPDEYSQKVSLLDRQPEIPSDWVYQPRENTDCNKNPTDSNVACVGGWAKCSCGRYKRGYGESINYWENKCPICGAVGSLVYGRNYKRSPCGDGANKGGGIEGHIFCCTNKGTGGKYGGHGCGADFCVTCGKDHGDRSCPHDCWLTPCVSGNTDPANCVGTEGLNQIGSPRQGVDPELVLKQIFCFVRSNVYFCCISHGCDEAAAKSMLAQIQAGKKVWGNCGKQASLCVYIARMKGFQARCACDTTCGGIGHCVGHYKYGNRTWTMDTVCKDHNTFSVPNKACPKFKGPCPPGEIC